MDITPEMARAELERRRAAQGSSGSNGVTPEMARAELERRRKAKAQPTEAPQAAQVQSPQPQASNAPPPANEGDGIGEMLLQSGANTLRSFGSTVGHAGADIFGGLGLDDPARWRGVGKQIAGWGDSIAPTDYTPAKPVKDPNGAWYSPSTYDWQQVAKSAVEGAVPMALSVNPFFAPVVAGTTTYGDILDRRMEEQGYTNPEQLTAGDKAAALATTGASAVLGRYGAQGLRSLPLADKALRKLGESVVGQTASKGGRALSLATGELGRRLGQVTSNVASKASKAGSELITEGLDDAIQQAGSTVATPDGMRVDPRQSVAAGAAGGMTRAGLSAPGVAIKAADNLLLGAQVKVKDRQAATNFANMAQSIAESEGINISDLTEANYANEANSKIFNTVHKELASRINGDFRRLAPLLKEDLGEDNARNLYDTVLTAVDVDKLDAAKKAGVNRHEGLVTKEQLAILDRIAGHTKEGQELLLNLRTSNEMTNFVTEMRKSKKGGITGTIENKVGRGVRSAAGVAAGAAGGTALGAFFTSPAAAAVADPGTALILGGLAAGTYGTLYGIDKATGRRSKAARYIDDYAGKAVNTIGGKSFVGERIRQRELLRAANNADKAAGIAQKVLSDQIYRQARVNPESVNRSFVFENMDSLTTGHLNALMSLAEANERKIIQENKARARTDKERQAADYEAYRADVLKYLTDQWRANALDPRTLEQYRSVLKPNEYKALVKEQLGDDKRKVDFAYRMAAQQAAEAEAVAADLERTAKELERDNRRNEALQARENAKAAREQAKVDRENARNLLEGIKSDLVLKEDAGTLTREDVLQHQGVLPSAQLRSFLKAVDKLKKAQRIKAERTRNGTHIGKAAGITAESVVNPNVRSPEFDALRRGQSTGPTRNQGKYEAKVAITKQMESDLRDRGALLMNTDQAPLGAALMDFADGMDDVKNDPTGRLQLQERLANMLTDPNMRAEFIAATNELRAAFGRSDEEITQRTRDAVRRTSSVVQ